MSSINKKPIPKISFGIIVLNGEPFTRYCIEQLYDYAHQIIVVEGGSRKAQAISVNGRSNDSTLSLLEEYKSRSDPEDKIVIVSKDGYWDSKTAQSQAYAAVATGDYLWQIDSDEFYTRRDMETILDLLNENPDIDGMSFKQKIFWGGFDYWCDSVYLHRVQTESHRLFKWRPGYRYESHLPPTVLDEQGVDLRTKNWRFSKDLESYGVKYFHYSLVFPKQVIEKSQYYSTAGESFRSDMTGWAENHYYAIKGWYKFHNVYEYPSWIFRNTEAHPEAITKLINDLNSNVINIDRRDNQDIEKLLSNPLYKMFRSLLIVMDQTRLFLLLIQLRRLAVGIKSRLGGI